MTTSPSFARCPFCEGENLDVCEDTYPGVLAFCLDWGWHTWVEEAQADLSEVNERRQDAGMEPLKELRTTDETEEDG
jgi:hypothetical protein